ncbi:MAG: bifunctional 4-hydroxy-3-methylbut-2-enyl diphosphate reductase/30S ribosomal protein S1 [Clostridiales bacterium]|nr:bifunctional 4-hydroxy-3-methylbut-2-enyl diphosphate reductase/30S ribosomal protein S1 [Clostridiales bacterium]
MDVFLAEESGMCFGVKRALDVARAAAKDAKAAGKSAYVVGQLVHNRQVSAYLSDLGIREITEEELRQAPVHGDMFIFPSHGKGPGIYDIVKCKNGSVVDAVCPFVGSALDQAREAVRDGFFVLIFGDESHDEVVAYRQWLGEDCLVTRDFEKELASFPLPDRLAVMAQTTADQEGFARLTEWLVSRGRQPKVIDAICLATRSRRAAAEGLAAQVDAMLVIGGYNSANTLHLTEYCRRLTKKSLAYQIETPEDIDFQWLYGVQSIGITAGASTPEWIIKEVVDMMEELKDQAMEQEQEQEQSQEQDLAQESGIVPEDVAADVEPDAAPDDEPQDADQNGEAPEASLPDEDAADAVQEDGEEPEDSQHSGGEASDDEAVEEEAISDTEAEGSASLPDEQDEPAEPVEEAIPAQEADGEGEEGQESVQDSEEDAEAEVTFSDLEAEIGFLEFHPGDLIQGTVVKVSSDEVLVDIGYKSEGIIPAFELAFTKVDPFTVVNVGDVISVEVMKEDRDGNVVLSRKNAMFEEKIDLLEEHFEKGEAIEATVIDVVKGGLLVDVGMRGFVPASHVERGFVKDLSEYLKKTLFFKILELNRAGRKVILSRKVLLEEEYQKAREAFWASVEEGQTRSGVVKRLTDFGAFVDIGGCDGLLHVSEMGWGKVGKPADVVSINDEIEVYVLKVDREKEKVSLSLKKLIPNPWDLASEKYQIGSIYTGKVMRGASFGAFIQLEPSLEGLAHISQLARFRVNKVEDVLVEGMEVPVKILDIDLEKRRISLSVKEAIDLPKLVQDEPEMEEFLLDEEDIGDDADADGESFMESDEEAGAGTVAEALGAAMADRVAEAFADTDADSDDEDAEEAGEDADTAADDEAGALDEEYAEADDLEDAAAEDDADTDADTDSDSDEDASDDGDAD